jgi:hypothetical protein
MSTVEDPAWTLTPAARAHLRDRVDRWFIQQGVPQFAEGYSAQASLYFLVLPLAVLVAFEIGAAPWLPLSEVSLLVVPPLVITPVVVMLMSWARPFIWLLLGREEEPAIRFTFKHGWRRLAGLLLVLGTLGVLLRRGG